MVVCDTPSTLAAAAMEEHTFQTDSDPKFLHMTGIESEAPALLLEELLS